MSDIEFAIACACKKIAWYEKVRAKYPDAWEDQASGRWLVRDLPVEHCRFEFYNSPTDPEELWICCRFYMEFEGGRLYLGTPGPGVALEVVLADLKKSKPAVWEELRLALVQAFKPWGDHVASFDR